MEPCYVYVYVIESLSKGKRYSGIATNTEVRLKELNSGKTRSTKGYTPWKLVYSERYDSVAEARAREKYFKTAAGRRCIIKKIGPVVQRIE